MISIKKLKFKVYKVKFNGSSLFLTDVFVKGDVESIFLDDQKEISVYVKDYVLAYVIQTWVEYANSKYTIAEIECIPGDKEVRKEVQKLLITELEKDLKEIKTDKGDIENIIDKAKNFLTDKANREEYKAFDELERELTDEERRKFAKLIRAYATESLLTK